MRHTSYLTCEGCPNRCCINIEYDEEKVYKNSGNMCTRGEDMAMEIVLAPKRALKTVMPAENGSTPYVMVKSSADLPKEIYHDVFDFIKASTVQAPIKFGDVLFENVLDSGIDIIAAADC